MLKPNNSLFRKHLQNNQIHAHDHDPSKGKRKLIKRKALVTVHPRKIDSSFVVSQRVILDYAYISQSCAAIQQSVSPSSLDYMSWAQRYASIDPSARCVRPIVMSKTFAHADDQIKFKRKLFQKYYFRIF